MPRALLLVAALLAAAAALILIPTGGGAPSTATPASPPAVAGGRAAAEPGHREGLPEGSPPEGTAPSERVAVLDAAERETDPRAEAVGSEPGSRPVLAGRVVTPDGAPVVGAEVWARRSLRAARRPVGAALSGRAEPQGRTDDAGRFAFPAPRPGAVEVTVRRSGHAPRREDVLVPAGGRHDLGDLVLEPGVPLSGRVLGPDGGGVAGAHLLSIPPGLARDLAVAPREQGFLVGETDAEGRFAVDQIAPGPWALVVLSAYPDELVEGFAHGPTTDIEVVLAAGAEITGEVRGAGERTRLEVRAEPVGGGDSARRSAAEQRVAHVGGGVEERAFAIRGLRAGAVYRLTLFRGSRPASGGVEVAAGSRGVVLEPWPTARLRVALVDASTGSPVEPARFTVEGGAEGSRWRLSLAPADERVEALGAGAYVLGELPVREASAPAELRVSAPGYGALVRGGVRLAPDAEVDLGVLRLPPEEVLEVRVVARGTGVPVEGARVRLGAAEGGPWPTGLDAGAVRVPTASTGRTDAEGRASLRAREGELRTLTAQHEDYAPSAPRDVVVALRGEPPVVELSRGARLVCRVVDVRGAPVAGRRVLRQRADGVASGDRAGREVTDADGRALFDRLRPGLHRFSVEGPRGEHPGEEAWVERLLRDGEVAELELVATAAASLSGRVTVDGVPLAGAQLWLQAGNRRNWRQRLLGAVKASASTVSDREGRYELVGARAGDHVLVVEHPTRALPVELPVTLEEGARVVLDVALSTTGVEGRVTTPDGWPVPGASVSVRFAQDVRRLKDLEVTRGGVSRPSSELARAGSTDAAGGYAVSGLPEGVPLVVVARAPGLQARKSRPFELSAGEWHRAEDLELPEAGELRLVVRRAEGGPAAGVAARMEWTGGRKGRIEVLQRATTDAAGRVAFAGLAPGAWRLELEAPDPSTGRPVTPREVEVLRGRPTRLEVVLP